LVSQLKRGLAVTSEQVFSPRRLCRVVVDWLMNSLELFDYLMNWLEHYSVLQTFGGFLSGAGVILT
jgi:hypothetical protein